VTDRCRVLICPTLSKILASCAFVLALVNLYGLTVDRDQVPAFLASDRSPRDLPLQRPLTRGSGERDAEYLSRLSSSVHSRMKSYWSTGREPVPFSDNYILNLLRFVSPVYTDYQYYDVGRAIERGIGQCGQFAIVLFEVLRKQDIPRKLILLPGHTMVAATLHGRERILDAQFGLVIPHSLAEVRRDPELVAPYYGSVDPSTSPLQYDPRTAPVGYDPTVERDIDPTPFTASQIAGFMTSVYRDPPVAVFAERPTDSRSVLFEPIAYVLKWALPAAMLALAALLWARGARGRGRGHLRSAG
jgi:hypothetical protein